MARAKTKAQIQRQEGLAYEQAVQAAVDEYLDTCDLLKPPSIRSIALRHELPRSTVQDRINGVPSRYDAAAPQNLLTKAESQTLITLLHTSADRGFPDTLAQARVRIIQLVRAKKNNPTYEIGAGFVQRWLNRYAGQLTRYWSTSLETVRANALNPETVAHWFTLLQSTIDQFNIPDHLKFFFDETNSPFGRAPKVKVIGRPGQRKQYQQRDGNRETATLIVLAGSGGQSYPPTVIFRGKNLSRELHANNPLKCPSV